jgi:hypothetical protein
MRINAVCGQNADTVFFCVWYTQLPLRFKGLPATASKISVWFVLDSATAGYIRAIICYGPWHASVNIHHVNSLRSQYLGKAQLIWTEFQDHRARSAVGLKL